MFFNPILKWLGQWRNLLLLIVEEFKFMPYYVLILTFFGILIGFLLGRYRYKYKYKYKTKNGYIIDIYIFMFYLLLILLIKILYDEIFDYDLLRNLYNQYFGSNIDNSFKDFYFGPLPEIESRSFKFILKRQEKIYQLPFSV